MKIFITLVLVFAVAPAFSQRYILQNPKMRADFVSLDFADSLNGIVAGTPNNIAYTTDGGISWSYYPSVLHSYLQDIVMISPTVATIALGNGGVFRSTNAGKTWLKATDPVNGTVPNGSDHISAVGAKAVGIGENGIIYNSSDSGKTWNISVGFITSQQNGLGDGISMGSNNAVIGFRNNISEAPIVEYSTDGGITWNAGSFDQAIVGNPATITSITMVSAQIGYLVIYSWLPVVGPTTMIARTADGGKTWTRRDDKANTFSLFGGTLSFRDVNHGALLNSLLDGTPQSLWLTDDGGVTWSQKNWPLSFQENICRDIKYLSNGVIVLCCKGGLLLLSADTAKTWVANMAYQNGSGSLNITGIAVKDSGVGIAVDFGASIARTTNKGDDWYDVSVPMLNASSKVIGVAFASDSIVVALVDSERYLRSTDAGNKWSIISSPSIPDSSIDFLKNTGFGISVGGKGTFARTYDWGGNWEWKQSATTQNLRQVIIHRSDKVYIYACGDGGTVIYSDDYGETWQDISTGLPSTAKVYSVSTIDDDVIFAVTSSNTVYRYSKNNPQWISVKNLQGAIGKCAIKMLTMNVVAVIAGTNKVWITHNGGNTWSTESSSDPYFGAAVMYVVSPTDIYFGMGGSIYRRIQGEYPMIADVDFGPAEFEPVLEPKDSVLRIVNTGTDVLMFLDAELKNSTSFSLVAPFVTDNSIAPGDTGMQGIRFSPTDVGSQQDTLFLSSDGLSYNFDTIIVSGVGTSNYAKILVTDSVLDYREVKGCADSIASFTIKNSGTADLDITSMFFVEGKTPPYTFLDPTTFSLQPTGSKTIHVRFAPVDTGIVVDSVKINSTDGNNPVSYIKLIGYGRISRVTINSKQTGPYQVDFGDVHLKSHGDSDTGRSVIHLLSSGNDTLQISSTAKIVNDNDAVFKITYKPADLSKYATGEYDSVTVIFIPRQEKQSTADIVITANDACDASKTIHLKGNGVAPVDVLDNKNSIAGFSLSQNYPNPFSGTTLIPLLLNGSQRSEEGLYVRVTDIFGREVERKKLIGDEKVVSLDASGWPTGLYFYSLNIHSALGRMMMVIH